MSLFTSIITQMKLEIIKRRKEAIKLNMDDGYLTEQINSMTEDYIEAWKSMYSNLDDLNGEQDELFSLIQNQMGIIMDTDDFEYLIDKELSIDDIKKQRKEFPFNILRTSHLCPKSQNNNFKAVYITILHGRSIEAAINKIDSKPSVRFRMVWVSLTHLLCRHTG